MNIRSNRPLIRARICLSDDIGQVFYISRKNGYRRQLAYIEQVYAADRWHNNKYVLKYFADALNALSQHDRLADILSDTALQSNIIDFFEFDSGLEYYLNQLKIVHEHLPQRCLSLLDGDTFREIFTKNRRLLYNSGMFFTLKELGLSVVLRQNDRDWGLEGEVGKVFYYYIVEDFAKAIKKAELLLNGQFGQMSDALLSEVYNVKGLSERKLVRFDDALTSFEKSIEYAELAADTIVDPNSDAEFELSLAYLIKGKIFLSTLRFDESNKSCKRAIKILARKIDEMPQSDKRISNALFLAEDYRVSAYGYIWQGAYEMAEDQLLHAEEIYRENSNTSDRYYIRYLYTCAFLKIMTGNSVGVIQELKTLLSEVSASKYDKGQLQFLLALEIWRNHPQDEALTAEGLKYAKSSSDIYDSIDALLEKSECDLLTGYLAGRLNKRVFLDSEDNAYIQQWTAYLDSVLNVP